MQSAIEGELLLPQAVEGSPVGRWHDHTQRAPFTRVPYEGSFEEFVRPSCLDYCMVRHCQVDRCHADWRLSPADHCPVITDVAAVLLPSASEKRCWTVAEGVDERMVAEGLLHEHLEHAADPEAFRQAALALQNVTQCHKSR